jgi:Protein of unknown function (DUF3500)
MADVKKPIDCPDCHDDADFRAVSRRDFVRSVGGVAAAVAVGGLTPFLGGAKNALADGAQKPSPSSKAETAAKRLYESLSSDQKKAICFPFDHDLRKKINANWAITELTIKKDFTKDQQATIDEIFRGVTSPDGYERFQKQMQDDHGGMGQYHVAMFGEPGSGQFEWEMTGRHMTIRADGDSVAGAAFGGPIIYGHGEGDSQKGLPGNVFYYQTQKANEVFAALDGKQRELALVPKAPPEALVRIQGDSGKFPGIGVGSLAADQKQLVEKVIKVLLAPYREEDVEEAMSIMKSGGGLDALHMAFYQADDIGADHEWDIWRLEGPTFVWHFRGAPHVHAYINIAKKS